MSPTPALAYNFRRLGAVAASDRLVVDRLARVVIRPRSEGAWCSRRASMLTALLTRLIRPAETTRYLASSCA